MDGESAGNIEDETFSADGATITINGVSAHPGFAKGTHGARDQDRVRHHRAAAEGHCSPETTAGRRAFCIRSASRARWRGEDRLIVRDFTEEGLKQKEALLEVIVEDVMKDYPRSTYKIKISSSTAT